MGFTPGVEYLGQRIHYLLIPLAIAYGTLHLLRNVIGLNIPTWLFVLACIITPPLSMSLATWATYWRQERAAAARGAVMPPIFDYKWPGALDVTRKMVKYADQHYLGYYMFKWTSEYGPTFNARIFGENRFMTIEPEHIKMILATDFLGYEKGPRFRFQMKSLLGVGVFNSDGEMWKFHRGMTRPFFSKDRISHFDIFDRHAEDALQQAKRRSQEGYTIDWQDLVSRFTLDSATEFLFGKDVKSLSAGLPYPPNTPEGRVKTEHPANDFSEAFLEAQVHSARRSRYTSSWPIFEIGHDKVAGPVQVVDRFIEPILRDALEKKAEKGNQGAQAVEKGVVEDDETLLGHLVALTDDPRILRDETLNILLAGRDTTAATLTYAGAMLAEHPKILKRLRDEVLTKVGNSRRPDYDDIRDMKYLRAFINEVLRLYPPVPFNVRTSTKEAIWPGPPGKAPFYVPANTRCMYSVLLMHRRKDLWGPDAHEFDPDRFLDDRLHKYLTPNPFIFLPFNAGPRICLGQQFAYNETSFMLIRLLQQFSSFELAQEVNPEAVPPPGWSDSPGSNGKDKVWMRAHLTMYARGGCWLKLGEATTAE